MGGVAEDGESTAVILFWRDCGAVPWAAVKIWLIVG